MSKEKLVGVVIFAGLILLSSASHMLKLILDVTWYFEILSYWPKWLIICRYAFSWLQRIVGIASAIGILLYKDIFRKILIIWGIITIMTVYWKHPYPAFKEHMLRLDRVIHFDIPATSLETITVVAIIVHCILDIIFQGCLIYYLTRKKVKARFH